MTFEMWSIGHYIFMISPIIVTIIIHGLTKKKSQAYKQNVGIVLSVIAVIILLLRNIEIFVNHGFVFDYEILPLQICHFANFVLLYAFITNSKSFFGLAILFNLPAAFMSIIFANSLENYSTILTLRGGAYIFGHLLIVVITIYAFLNSFMTFNRKILKRILGMFILLNILGLVVNNVMLLTTGEASNYFYATRPEHGTPLEMFFNWGVEYNIGGYFIVNPIYILSTTLLGVSVICILYVVLSRIQPSSKQKTLEHNHLKAGYRSYVKE